jgi:hypothetical protein
MVEIWRIRRGSRLKLRTAVGMQHEENSEGSEDQRNCTMVSVAKNLEALAVTRAFCVGVQLRREIDGASGLGG